MTCENHVTTPNDDNADPSDLPSMSAYSLGSRPPSLILSTNHNPAAMNKILCKARRSHPIGFSCRYRAKISAVPQPVQHTAKPKWLPCSQSSPHVASVIRVAGQWLHGTRRS